VFLLLFMIVHSFGNLHIFLGPDDMNSYGYFYDRQYFSAVTNGAIPIDANVLEIYLYLAILLHISVALKRTWDINRTMTFDSGKMNMAFTGVILLGFMIVHLQQFRFATTSMYLVRPVPYLINLNPSEVMQLRLFWTTEPGVPLVEVRDLYKLEFDIFGSWFWSAFYIFCTCVFMAHGMWGWQKLVPSSAFRIPQDHQAVVIMTGWILVALIGLCYFSFPALVLFGNKATGVNWEKLAAEQAAAEKAGMAIPTAIPSVPGTFVTAP